MNSKKLITATEVGIGAALFIFIIYGMYLGRFVGLDPFLEYVREDGPVEWPTSIFLFFGSLICLYRVFQYRKMKKPLWLLTYGTLALLFFFAAGEEISWGQRIFGIESSEFFLEHNKQAETNLHNMIVKGHNLNKVIFAAPVFMVLIIYFGFARLMVTKIAFIRNLVTQFHVPLPKNQHIIMMVVATLMILAINLTKESELHELSFALIFFLIFLNPYKVDQE